MKLPIRWGRPAPALIAAAAIAGIASTPASAAPVRTATTTQYQRADFLQRTLGVPADTVIDSVTYDRFQHLLRQAGTFAILIGDPATDATFKARAVAVDAAARAAGVPKVYWFNPNLTGGAKVGAATVPNLDIRAADDFRLTESSRTKFKDAWQNLIAQSLGNGVTATRTYPGEQRQLVETQAGQAGAVNDSTDPIYDYTAGTPANVADSYFLVYDTGATSGAAKDKIVSSVNLTDDADAAAKVAAAIAGKAFARVEQFAWWREEANERQRVGSEPFPYQGPEVPVLTGADNAAADGGWRVNQITYAELIDLLDHSTDADAVILFGGTWCPNTRAVLPFVNREAQKNDVTVYNFDTVLDGGKVAGSPTSGANPLQTRNPHGNADAEGNRQFVSYLYGELVNRYLGNFTTEYQVSEANAITYFPHGDTTKPALKQARLQVPYLFGYRGKGGTGPQNGVTRQWIQKGSTNPARTHTEYMSNWYYTNPVQNRAAINIPAGAPVWQKLNAAIAGFTYKTDVFTIVPSRSVYTDTADYLVNETATVGVDAQGVVTVTSGGPTDISQPALTAALAALGANAPKTLAEARTAWLADKTNPHLTTIAGAWGTVDTRKGNVVQAFGTPTTPNSIAGGAAAKRALDVFFGGLPGGVLSTRTVTANPVTAGTAATISLTVANEHGRKPAGTVALVVEQGATNVTSASAAITGDAVSFTLPPLPAGTYEFTLTYAGDDQLAGFTETGSLTVTPAPVADPPAPPVTNPGPAPTPTATKAKASKLSGAVAKAPTSRKAGKYKVTITTPKAGAKATGKVTLKLKKGRTTKTVTGTLKNGTVTVTVPKLARPGDRHLPGPAGDAGYQAGSAAGASIKVKQ